MTEETITVKREDLEEIRRVWYALDGLDGILRNPERTQLLFVESILRVIMDKFNTAFADIDDLLRESK